MTTRLQKTLAALMEFVEQDSESDRMCRECFRIVRDELGIQDEQMLLAARFMYPLSPGCDREKQLAVLAGCGHSLKDAKRIITLMETHRGLHGDQQKSMLADVMARVYLSDQFYKPDDRMWLYGLERWWDYTTSATRTDAQKQCDKLKTFSTDFTQLHLESALLGRSVRDSFASGCGFPNVHFPWLEHALDITLFDPLNASMDEFDRSVKAWTQGSADLRENVRKGLIEHKDMVADACGEDFAEVTSDNIFSHVDLTYGNVTDGDDGLEISIGERCSWEPEHGVIIMLDKNGSLLKVGER